MRRRAPITAEALERVKRAAMDARVKAGLSVVDPGDEEYERLQAERKRERPKVKSTR